MNTADFIKVVWSAPMRVGFGFTNNYVLARFCDIGAINNASIRDNVK